MLCNLPARHQQRRDIIGSAASSATFDDRRLIGPVKDMHTMIFPSNGWRERLVAAVDGDKRFETASEQFDGSVAFEVGEEVGWFKIYRGSVIDSESYVPAFGVTFRVVGDVTAWQQLVDGEASFSEQVYSGRLRTAGNKLEANRMREATELLVRHLRDAEGVDA